MRGSPNVLPSKAEKAGDIVWQLAADVNELHDQNLTGVAWRARREDLKIGLEKLNLNQLDTLQDLLEGDRDALVR